MDMLTYDRAHVHVEIGHTSGHLHGLASGITHVHDVHMRRMDKARDMRLKAC
ncbi:hypothetical protein BCR44DRAFT_37208 [Catenaria anguillulae PL171]|uniref:Uncharacterized protein n=1 Tax=Catenaria anguillulae PL171 TaxID=765915 RepID=A0A1Y2HB68_9FUNG|nr:hypothetical protein BCR44DRAFT_37208 [Catenaria anguillulae PL171]